MSLQTVRVLFLLLKSWFIYFFSSLIAVAKTSKTMFNNSGESGHSFLVPDFRRSAFSFLPLRIMFVEGLSYIGFIMLRYIPSLHAFWRVFIINGCWILSKAFSASIEIIIWFLSFNLLMWCIKLIDYEYLLTLILCGDKKERTQGQIQTQQLGKYFGIQVRWWYLSQNVWSESEKKVQDQKAIYMTEYF